VVVNQPRDVVEVSGGGLLGDRFQRVRDLGRERKGVETLVNTMGPWYLIGQTSAEA